jgi:hypothetical protein
MFWNLLPKFDPTATWTRANGCVVGMLLLLRSDPVVRIVLSLDAVADVAVAVDDDVKDEKWRVEFPLGKLSDGCIILADGLQDSVVALPVVMDVMDMQDIRPSSAVAILQRLAGR